MIKYLADYLQNENPKITSHDSISYGSSLLAFIEKNKDQYQIAEFDVKQDTYNFDLSNCLAVYKSQKQECARFNSKFNAPAPNQLITYSEGVIDDKNNIEGIRTESPNKVMSGWVITSGLYNGDIHTLRHQHAIEFIRNNPNLSKYLALDTNYWFTIKDGVVDVDKS